MKLELTEEQASDLVHLLQGALGDLSSEIAATDNPAYREGLRSRRASLEAALAQLEPAGNSSQG